MFNVDSNHSFLVSDRLMDQSFALIHYIHFITCIRVEAN